MDTQLYDHLQNPVLVVDGNGQLEYFNFVCSLFFKLPPRKLNNIGYLSELLEVQDFDLNESIEKSLEQDAPIVSPELDFVANGNRFTSIFKFIPIEGKVVVHIQDFSIEKQLHSKYKQQILELKDTHDQIVKADKLTAMGEMIAGISHEIASPLTVAADTLFLLSESLHVGDYETTRSELTNLEKEFTRIRQIVSSMQSMSKNKDDDIHIVDMEEVVGKSIDFVRELGLLNNVNVNVKIQQARVLANDTRLQQVFINFIKNSIDAMTNSDRKILNIVIDVQNDVVSLDFVDTGCGLKDPDKIFDMFYTTKEYGDGTGLGLTISQKIIKSYHGNINILPSQIGTHFRLDFPRLDLESFSVTNRYFSGESEVEDVKVIVYANDLSDLNDIFKEFHTKAIILILTDDLDRVEEMCESYMADYLVMIKHAFPSNISCNTLDVKSNEIDDYIKKIWEVVDDND